MKFGYAAGSRGDLLSEIEFGKANFDFVEITIKPELLRKFDPIMPRTKEMIAGFEVLGHIHGDILAMEDIKKNIEIFKELGTIKITIHPFLRQSVQDNIDILSKISEFCVKNETQLLLENISKPPYNSVQIIAQILDAIPAIKLALDIGHANRAGELDNFFETFRGRIGHIHLHDNAGDFDHLFFSDKSRFEQAISKIKANGYDDTILMETFAVIKDGKSVSLETLEDIKQAHISQLKIILC